MVPTRYLNSRRVGVRRVSPTYGLCVRSFAPLVYFAGAEAPILFSYKGLRMFRFPENG